MFRLAGDQNRTGARFILALCLLAVALALPLLLLQANLERVAFSPPFYQRQFQRWQVVEGTGMSRDDLARGASLVRGYLQGSRADLYLPVRVDGQVQPLFTPREQVHLEDVRELFQQGRAWRTGAMAALLLAWGLAVWVRKAPWWDTGLLLLGRGAFLSLLLLLLMGLILALDFERWFLWFHLAAFDNNFWMLDPRHHMMIRMFPQPFFVAAARETVLGAFLGLGLLAAGGWWVRRHYGSNFRR